MASNDVENAAAQDAAPIHENASSFTDRIASTICVTLFLVVCNIIPITMILIGWTHYQDCPIEPKIALWMLLSGGIWLFQSTVKFLWRRSYARSSPENRKLLTTYAPFSGILDLLSLVLLLMGTYWVYSVYSSVQYDDRSLASFCDRNVYLFAFLLITAMYVVMIVTLVCYGCFCICGAVMGAKDTF